MGHDISAFTKKMVELDEYGDEQFDNEIAYLRRGAFSTSERKNEIYKCLNQEDQNCGCSGCGGTIEYNLSQIESALNYALNNDCEEDVVQFLHDCMDVLENGVEKVYVGFW